MILFNGSEIVDSGSSIRYARRVASGEKLSLTLVCLDGGEASFDLDIDGADADVQLRGLYVCSGEQRLRVAVNMRHNHGGSTSDQLFRGIVSDNSRAAFEGLIYIAHDAQKTQAYQTNRNIQLSDSARVETSPQLEIYADDVKCSHGATVGSLDMDEQFYMRSRGISLQEARRLQMISFLAPVLGNVPEDVREQVWQKLR